MIYRDVQFEKVTTNLSAFVAVTRSRQIEFAVCREAFSRGVPVALATASDLFPQTSERMPRLPLRLAFCG